MRTLIATDGSKEATVAVHTASRLLRKSRNELEVLCAAPELYRRSEPAAGRESKRAKVREKYRRLMAKQADSVLENANRILLENGYEPKLLSEIGSPVDVILKLSEEHDVTVIGAPSPYHATRAGLGSVASRVVEHAANSVLVAREVTGSDTLRVLVGVDGSLASYHALNSMAAYFEIGEAEITLIHVKETPWIHLGLDREWLDQAEMRDEANPTVQFEEELQREAEEVFERAQAMLAKYDYSVLTQIQEGNPATEILGEAESGQYDLIVLGASDAMDSKHCMLGSVSAKVAWQAPCSVAVVKVPR